MPKRKESSGDRERDFTKESIFPSPLLADENGFIGFSRVINCEMLKDAYFHGIFPWPFDHSGVIPWCAPLTRGILPIEKFHIPHGLKRDLKKFSFTLRVDTNFEAVMRNCAAATRPEQDDTWITEKMIRTYVDFYKMGYAHSFETYSAEGELVGGLYGVSVGKVFCGESMFYKVSGASKFAFVKMVEILRAAGVELIDTQMVTEATAAFGAYEIPAAEYYPILERLRGGPLSFKDFLNA